MDGWMAAWMTGSVAYGSAVPVIQPSNHPVIHLSSGQSPYVAFYRASSAFLKFLQALVTSGALRIAETTQIRCAPAAITS